jgi:hypothetical protein
MRYSDWTEQEWERLRKMARADGIRLKDEEIREAAGNRFGLEGTIIALCVDATSSAIP